MTGKLYGTLGPACADTDTLRALLRAGMRGVRLNLSHGPLEERAPWLESLRRAETAEGVSCELLIDLQGPELRVGALFAPLTLREGDTLTLGEAFPVPPILTGNLQDGDELLLDDGALSLRVLDARAMTCRVERGGVLRSRKSLAVAGRELPASALTEMDMENLSRAREYGVTALMQPFVRGADDLRAARGLIVTDADADSVTVRLKGTRRVLGNLSSADLSAVIDVSGISQAREMQVSYSLQYPTNVDKSSITVLSKSPETISFSVVQEANKTLEVKGVFTGSVKEGYTAEPIKVEPSSITLYGPQEELDVVDSICVYVTRTDLDKSIAPTNCPYVLLDKDGNKLKPKEISGNYDTVSVSMPVLMNKELPLKVSLVGGAGATEENCVVDIEPKSIQVAGDTDVLGKLNQIVVATIDLSGFATSYEKTVTIPLENDLRNLSGVTEATVRVSVRGLATEKITATNITTTGTTRSVEIMTTSLAVTVRAPEDVISQITAENVRVVVDLTNYKATSGTVAVPAKIYVDGFSNAGAVGEYVVNVRFTGG